MKHFIIKSALIVAYSSLCLFSSAQAPASKELETIFKNAFEKYKQAIIAKSNDQLLATWAPSSYMRVKNVFISQKMNFPADFFNGLEGRMSSGVNIQKLKTLRASEKNSTGVLVLFAPKSVRFDPFGMGGSGEPQPMLVTIRFIKLSSTWKYDDMVLDGIEDEDEGKILKGDLSKINDTKYKPTGIVPPIPAQEAPPDYDYDAMLNVIFGDQVEITINGKSLGKVHGAMRTGVKKGENIIVIKSPPQGLKISLYAKKDENSDPYLVFEMDEDVADKLITKKFTVE